MKLPVWKIMQSDGVFYTFLIADASGKSIKTSEGTFEITSDSTLTEHITAAITDQSLIGKNNVIRYHFSDSDTLHFQYRLPDATQNGEETWIRVKLEVPN